MSVPDGITRGKREGDWKDQAADVIAYLVEAFSWKGKKAVDGVLLVIHRRDHEQHMELMLEKDDLDILTHMIVFEGVGIQDRIERVNMAEDAEERRN